MCEEAGKSKEEGGHGSTRAQGVRKWMKPNLTWG
jgi:hypothetical protein